MREVGPPQTSRHGQGGKISDKHATTPNTHQNGPSEAGIGRGNETIVKGRGKPPTKKSNTSSKSTLGSSQSSCDGEGDVPEGWVLQTPHPPPLLPTKATQMDNRERLGEGAVAGGRAAEQADPFLLSAKDMARGEGAGGGETSRATWEETPTPAQEHSVPAPQQDHAGHEGAMEAPPPQGMTHQRQSHKETIWHNQARAPANRRNTIPRRQLVWYQIRCHHPQGPQTLPLTLSMTSMRLSTKVDLHIGNPDKCHSHQMWSFCPHNLSLALLWFLGSELGTTPFGMQLISDFSHYVLHWMWYYCHKGRKHKRARQSSLVIACANGGR